MTKIFISGAGAFGVALALSLEKTQKNITLITRDPKTLSRTRRTTKLPGVIIPQSINIIGESSSITEDDILLLAIPLQKLSLYLQAFKGNPGIAVACCKGIDLKTNIGPTEIIKNTIGCTSAILTGPSFASDIAKGLPTALTIATKERSVGTRLQTNLSTDTLRLYLSTDPQGAELGGALKNIIAIACGLCMGAGYGESARSALLTRGFSEILRFATQLGAEQKTLYGLSGLGDLVLTCTSPQSRNYSYGFSIGASKEPNMEDTIEGIGTAQAVLSLSKKYNLELPIIRSVVDIIEGSQSVDDVLQRLLKRPLGEE